MKIKRRTDYFLVPQEALCDRRLSLEQLGFLCTLYDLQGEKTDEWSLAGQCRITVGEVIEMLKSLTDLGYLSRCDGGYVLRRSQFQPIFSRKLKTAKFLTAKRTRFAIRRHVEERNQYAIKREFSWIGAKPRRTAKCDTPVYG